MLHDFWYIAAESRELKPARPLSRRLLGRDFVLWRDARGVAHALDDLCIHRGVPLSQGEVDGDCIRCPFHGWAFNGEGRCTLIPSNGPSAPVPATARTVSHGVQERGGYVWIYTGSEAEGARPVLQTLDELDPVEWVAGRRHDDVRAHYTRVIEQAIDIAHVPWVHRRTIGRSMQRDAAIEREVVKRPDGVSIYFKGQMPDWLESLHRPMNDYYAVPQSSRLGDGLHFTMPNLFRVVQGGMIMGLFAVPVDEGTTRIYHYVARRWLRRVPVLSSLISWFTVLVNLWIIREDVRILEIQAPKRMPEDVNAEMHVRADDAQIHYRRLRATYFAARVGSSPELPRPGGRMTAPPMVHHKLA